LPKRAGTGDAFADWINGAQKYVVSDILTEPDLTWQPTTIIRSANLLTEVSALRERPGGDIYVCRSLSIVRARLAADLVLMIEPITLGGGGKTLFSAMGTPEPSGSSRTIPPPRGFRSAGTGPPADLSCHPRYIGSGRAATTLHGRE